jgi:chromosome segregation ATPase
MMEALHRPTSSSANGAHPSDRIARHELERRLQGVLARLETARQDQHQALEAVRAAEASLQQRRQEREQAAELVAELAELAESLQRSLNGRS